VIEAAPPLIAVDFADPRHGWAVGSVQTVFKTVDGGSHWTTQSVGAANDSNLTSVLFADADRGWIVGQTGNKVFRTTDGGAHWTRIRSGTGAFLASVAFADRNSGLAVGDYGVITATKDSGVSWALQRKADANAPWLYSVAFPDVSHAWAVGDRGTILVYAAASPDAAGGSSARAWVWWVLAALVLLAILAGAAMRTRARR
jgi:photosystem II stability/assembly factor-like uncharacterized protein